MLRALARREHHDADAVGIPVILLAGKFGSLHCKGGAQPFHAAEFPLLSVFEVNRFAAHRSVQQHLEAQWIVDLFDKVPL